MFWGPGERYRYVQGTSLLQQQYSSSRTRHQQTAVRVVRSVCEIRHKRNQCLDASPHNGQCLNARQTRLTRLVITAYQVTGCYWLSYTTAGAARILPELAWVDRTQRTEDMSQQKTSKRM